MRGDLRQSSLAEVMRHLYAERKNGILHLSLGDVKRRIHLEKGVPIFADAADGQIPAQDQALSLLYSLFAWTLGEFAFEDLEPNVDDAHAFTLSPSVLILEGSRSVRDGHVLEHLTGGRQSVFACSQTSELPLFTMKLSSAESAILKFARDRERFTARDLPFKSEGVIVLNALNALLAVGLLEIVEKANTAAPEPPEPPPAPSPPLQPAPEPAQRAAPEGSEVKNLLDAFDSKRTGVSSSSPSVEWKPPPPPPAIETVAASEQPTPRVASPPAPPVAKSAPEPPPASEPAPRVASGPSEVENLLDTFESKRTGVSSSSQRAERKPPPPPPPAIETAEASEEPAPRIAPPAALAPSEPVLEPPAPALAPPLPPPATDKSSLSDLISNWVPTTRRGKRIAMAVVAFAAVVGLGLSWLVSRDGEPAPPAVEAIADSMRGNVTPGRPTVVPDPPKAETEPKIEAEPERSEAELFYSANLAFENGEYERSEADLVVLLERQPDFKAARELLARVYRELAPEPPPPERSLAPRRVAEKPPVPEPEPKPTPQPEPTQPAAPDPARLLDEARRAFARGDLRATGEKLDELEVMEPAHPGARTLRGQLVDRLWERNLPIVLSVRHDHALGGCDGVLTLTRTGYGYRSNAHEWIWSFGEVLETARRESNRLRIETSAGASFNFDVRDALSDDDWARHRALGDR